MVCKTGRTAPCGFAAAVRLREPTGAARDGRANALLEHGQVAGHELVLGVSGVRVSGQPQPWSTLNVTYPTAEAGGFSGRWGEAPFNPSLMGKPCPKNLEAVSHAGERVDRASTLRPATEIRSEFYAGSDSCQQRHTPTFKVRGERVSNTSIVRLGRADPLTPCLKPGACTGHKSTETCPRPP